MKKLFLPLLLLITTFSVCAQSHEAVLTKEQNDAWIAALRESDLSKRLERIKERWQQDASFHYEVAKNPYKIISVRDHEDKINTFVGYFQKIWANETSMMVYEDAITHAHKTESPLPQWYLLSHNEDIVGDRHGKANILLGQQDCSLHCFQADNEVAKLCNDYRRQPLSGFIQHQQVGIAHQRSGDGQHLLLSAR